MTSNPRVTTYLDGLKDLADGADPKDYAVHRLAEYAVEKIQRLRAALEHAMEQGGNRHHRTVRCFRCEEAQALLESTPRGDT